MKIIDRENARRLKKEDPVKKQDEKPEDSRQNELSPMDPPEAYDPPGKVDKPENDNYPEVIKILMEEHQHCLTEIQKFEDALINFHQNHWQMDTDTNKTISGFFEFLDKEILSHNEKEEKVLFPLLNKRLKENGEHSQQADANGKIRTPIDVMEDEHIQFAQLSTLILNFLGVSSRLPDQKSGNIVCQLAYDQGRELIELLRLHIYREDEILFPLAVKHISREEFDNMKDTLKEV